MTIDERRKIDLEIAGAAMKEGRLDDSLKVASAILDYDPKSAAAMYIAAYSFIRTERYGIAHALLRQSLAIKPKAATLNNLAQACIAMLRLDEAEMYCQQAIKMADEDDSIDKSAPLANLSCIAIYNSEPEKALKFAAQSLAIKPDNWIVQEQVGYAHLLRGEYEEGWLGYEAIIGHAKARKYVPPYESCPYWLGEDVQSIYLRGEQGVGDEIAFASCLPDAILQTPNITLECDAKLEGLFKRSFPTLEIHGTRHAGDRGWLEGRKFDAHALIGTLSKYYRKTKDAFPGTPFLTPDPERRLQWRALLDALPGKKVGIAWTGGLKNTFRERRSLTLERLKDLLVLEGVTWVSLQYEDPSDEIEQFAEQHGIEVRHWKRAGESADYDDQAALVAELDCVVSVPTAIVHLAGAIGKKCLVINPSKSHWFFAGPGRSIPWYESIEVYRQGKEWPFAEVETRLREVLSLEAQCTVESALT